MKLKTFFSICASAALLATGTVHLRAQSLEPFNPYGIFSPSVEAWQMTRYGNLTPSLYTGAMTFSLPLYTYEDPDFTIPISLEYSFDGYRPAQHSGTVGYGWYLNCGGVITREVRGIPDEGVDVMRHGCRTHGWKDIQGYAYVSNLAQAPVYSIDRLNADYIADGICFSKLYGYDLFSDTPMYCTTPASGSDIDLYDPASDIYHFNLLGHQGNFVIQKDGSVSVYGSDLPAGELSVAIAWRSDTFAPVITISTGDGYSYTFTEGGTSSSFGNSLDGNHVRGTTVTDLKLDRIKAPNGRKVEFGYTLTNATSATKIYLPMKRGWVNYFSMAYGDQSDYFYDTPDPKEVYIEETVRSLSDITVYDDSTHVVASVSFRYSNAPDNEYALGCFKNTADISTHLCGRQTVLTGMTVFNDSSEVVDSAEMIYAAAQSGTPKTFLASVATMHGGRYAFGYNLSGYTLPKNDTEDTDHWGYWNGRQIDTLSNHLVAGGWTNPGHLYDQMTDGVKEADGGHSVCGALTQISYPTGGTSTVAYGPNKVRRRLNAHLGVSGVTVEPCDSTDTSAEWEVGGVRVESITDSNAEGETYSEIYTYEDTQGLGSGMLMQMPLYARVVPFSHNATNISGSLSDYESELEAVGFNGVCNFRLSGDPHVTYTQVKRTHPDGSYTRYRFTSVDDGYMDVYNVPSVYTIKHTACLYDVIGSASTDLGSLPICLPNAGGDCSGMRGRLLSETAYDASGTEVFRMEKSYTVSGVNTGLAFYNDLLTYRGTVHSVLSPLVGSSTETLHGMINKVTYTYNSRGQRKSEEHIVGTGATADTTRTTYTYLHESVDTTTLTAALTGAELSKIEAGTAHVLASEEYSYGEWPSGGNPKPTLIRRTEPYGGVRSTVVSYDALFRPLTLTESPGGGSVTYTWDGTHLTSRTDNGTGNKTSFSWKDLVGPTLITSPSGRSTAYGYDNRNRLSLITDSSGSTVTKYYYKMIYE